MERFADRVPERRWQQIERRLMELGAASKGSQAFTADRISDLIEQIDELRKELQRVAERQDKIADYLKTQKNGGSNGNVQPNESE